MKKWQVGKIDINKVNVSGFVNPPHLDKIKALIKQVSNSHISIFYSKDKCTIFLHDIETTVVFGVNNRNKNPYATMTIKYLASESNLVSITMGDIQTCILKACRLLKELFNINLQYSPGLKITYIEISKTIKLDYDYIAYRPTIRMLTTGIDADKKTTHFFDKKREMADTNTAMTDSELLCLKYVLKSASAVNDNLGTNLLVDVDDSKITDYFLRKTTQLFDQAEELLINKQQYIPLAIGSEDMLYNDKDFSNDILMIQHKLYSEIYIKFMNTCYHDSINLYC
jgi:hypothetical protein